MEISVELTLTPLQNDYEEHVIEFIKRLRKTGLTVLENPLSTQVYGDFNEVMDILKKEIEDCFNNIDAGLITMKLVKSNRSEYEPDF